MDATEKEIHLSFPRGLAGDVLGLLEAPVRRIIDPRRALALVSAEAAMVSEQVLGAAEALERALGDAMLNRPLE